MTELKKIKGKTSFYVDGTSIKMCCFVILEDKCLLFYNVQYYL